MCVIPAKTSSCADLNDVLCFNDPGRIFDVICALKLRRKANADFISRFPVYVSPSFAIIIKLSLM